jgi:hypothetical protein
VWGGGGVRGRRADVEALEVLDLGAVPQEEGLLVLLLERVALVLGILVVLLVLGLLRQFLFSSRHDTTRT